MLDANAKAMRHQQIIAESEMQRLRSSAESRLAEEAKSFKAEREATLQLPRGQMELEREELKRQALQEFEKQKIAFEKKATAENSDLLQQPQRQREAVQGEATNAERAYKIA